MTIMLGNKYKDEENFIWEVRSVEDGRMIIECDDLMVKEELFPRLSHCELVSLGYIS